MTDATEYYEITIPRGGDVPHEITASFEELVDHLLRISERLNDHETRIGDLE